MAGVVYTWPFWAKSNPENLRSLDLLERHIANVGRCFEVLLVQPIIRRRLARAGNLDSTNTVIAARLEAFASLHDTGKGNSGFQTQVRRDTDMPMSERRLSRTGVQMRCQHTSLPGVHTLQGVATWPSISNDTDVRAGRR